MSADPARSIEALVDLTDIGPRTNGSSQPTVFAVNFVHPGVLKWARQAHGICGKITFRRLSTALRGIIWDATLAARYEEGLVYPPGTC